MAVDRGKIDAAVHARRDFIVDNINTLSLKACRKMLEEDLGLPPKGLDDYKDVVTELVEKLVLNANPELQKEASTGAATPKVAGKRKQAGTGASKDDNPSKKGKVSPQAAKSKVSKARPAAEEEEESGGSGKESEDSDAPTKRSKKRKAAAKPAPTAKTKRSAAVQKLLRIARQATIPVPPNVYMKNPSDVQLREALTELLGKHGLSDSAEARQVEKVKRQLQLRRDLEGIDTTNILENSGRGSRRAATRGVNYAAQLAVAKGSDEEDEEDEEEEEREDDDDDEEASVGELSAGDDEIVSEQGADSDVEEADDEEDEEAVRPSKAAKAEGSGRKQKGHNSKEDREPPQPSSKLDASAKEGKPADKSVEANEAKHGPKRLIKEAKGVNSPAALNGKENLVTVDADSFDGSDGEAVARKQPARTLAAWSDDED